MKYFEFTFYILFVGGLSSVCIQHMIKSIKKRDTPGFAEGLIMFCIFFTAICCEYYSLFIKEQ